jgi:putative phosphoesterase
MRVAALYDIHGNLPALEAVIQEIRQLQVDQIVVGGDVILGPIPRETLTYLLDLDIPIQLIQGNCDREIVAQMEGTASGTLAEQARGIVQWTGQQLDPEHQQVLASWPKTLSVEIPGLGKVLFCHATPRNDMDVFTRLTPEDRLLPIFEGLNVSLVVCGHTHMQLDRMIGKVRVVNAGSVGMPYGNPGAYWLLLGPDVQLKHTAYGLAEAAERIRQTSYPQATDFANNHVLQPPTEEKILEIFTKVELK